jgi:hypothetical protein
MSINLIKSVNFGSGNKSLLTVGYRLINSGGEISGSRIDSGIGELYSSTGIYSASIHFSSGFKGTILWDTGGSSPQFAADEYNSVEEQISFIKAIEGGRWKIDSGTNEMIFYDDGNSAEVARFDLKDSNGDASSTEVFERVRK